MESLKSEWFWLTIGLSLFFLEFIAPGIFCIWIGSAALLTSFIAWIVGLSLKASLFCFSILAFASIGIGYYLTSSNQNKEAWDTAFLNTLDHNLIGHVFLLKDPIREGIGSIQVHDTLWRVQGDNLPGGAKVRVLSRKGNMLIVEPVT
jgi:membrane protein implicated in regulation of membrane protease activity